MLWSSTIAGPPGPTDERRAHDRSTAYGLPLATPEDAWIVDCSRRGVGIEIGARPPVGSLTRIGVVLPEGELSLLGRVRWSLRVADEEPPAEARPTFRAGVAFVEGQSFGIWHDLVSGLTSPETGRPLKRGRRVVKWRRPEPEDASFEAKRA